MKILEHICPFKISIPSVANDSHIEADRFDHKFPALTLRWRSTKGVRDERIVL